MNEAVEAVLAEYEQREQRESEVRSKLGREEIPGRRDEFLLSVGRRTGQLLNILARESMSRSILEIGTSYGYSTVWLAEAARETGGKLITLEKHPEKVKHARSQLERAGLAGHVEFRVGDAPQLIAESDEKFDFVLIDLWKELYVNCFERLSGKLNHGALIVADNMVYPENSRKETEAYRTRVRREAAFDSILLPVGSGLEVSRYTGI